MRRFGRFILIPIAVLVAAFLSVYLSGCTPEQREDCFPCNLPGGVCALAGDDQTNARRKHPAWFLFNPAPASQPADANKEN